MGDNELENQGAVALFNNLSNVQDSNWRETAGNIRKKWEYALDNGLFTDLTFTIGRNKEVISCHSLILKLQSKVFAEKYNTGFKTELDWIEPNHFRLFLKYLYNETVSLEVEDAISILLLATEWDITKLIKICTEKVRKGINEENAIKVYQKAHDIVHHELEEFAKLLIIRKANRVFSSPGFVELTSDCVEALMAAPGRDITEVDAFKALLRWASAENKRENGDDEMTRQNLQEIVCKIIPHINFRLFTTLEFVQVVSPSGVLSDKEALNTLTQLTLTQNSNGSVSGIDSSISTLAEGAHKGENKQTSLNIEANVFTLQRYKGPVINQLWLEEKGTDKISFKTSKSIGICGLGLYGSSTTELGNEETTTNVEIQITNFEESKCFGSISQDVSLPKESGMFKVYFKDSVTIKEGVWYTIKVTIDGPVKPYGTGGVKSYTSGCGDETILWEFQNSKGVVIYSLGKGQIPEIYFAL